MLSYFFNRFRTRPFFSSLIIAMASAAIFIALVGSGMLPLLGIVGLIGLGGALSAALVIALNAILTVLLGATLVGAISLVTSFLTQKIYIKTLEPIRIDLEIDSDKESSKHETLLIEKAEENRNRSKTVPQVTAKKKVEDGKLNSFVNAAKLFLFGSKTADNHQSTNRRKDTHGLKDERKGVNNKNFFC